MHTLRWNLEKRQQQSQQYTQCLLKAFDSHIFLKHALISATKHFQAIDMDCFELRKMQQNCFQTTPD